MSKLQNVRKKIATVLEYAVGISLAVCLFVGGLGFIGYLVAFCIGGDIAAEICAWLYTKDALSLYTVLIKLGTYTTLACFVLLYVRGDAKWVNPVKHWKAKLSKEKTADPNSKA